MTYFTERALLSPKKVTYQPEGLTDSKPEVERSEDLR